MLSFLYTPSHLILTIIKKLGPYYQVFKDGKQRFKEANAEPGPTVTQQMRPKIKAV